MRPSFARQRDMLACALTDLLWKVSYYYQIQVKVHSNSFGRKITVYIVMTSAETSLDLIAVLYEFSFLSFLICCGISLVSIGTFYTD